MFSPRSTDAGAFDRTARYSQAAGVVTSGSGSVARKPRPPGKRKQARGGRRQVLTARVRLDAILHPEQDDASSTAAASTKPVVPQLALNQVQPATASGAGVGAGAGAAVRTPAGTKSASYARAAANTYARTTAGSYHTPGQPSHPPPSAYTRRHHTPRLPPSSAMSSSRSAKTRPGIPNGTESSACRCCARRARLPVVVHAPLCSLPCTHSSHRRLLARDSGGPPCHGRASADASAEEAGAQGAG